MKDREIDALIAEKVFDWKLRSKYFGWKLPDGSVRDYEQVKNYSTDIAAAWSVVEKMMGDQYDYIFRLDFLCGRLAPGRVWAYFDKGMSRYSGYGQDAPHAICLAALEAVSVNAKATA